MPKPLKAIRPFEKHVSVPQDLCTRVDLLLWSEVEGRVPHGAWSRYVTRLIENDMAMRDTKASVQGEKNHG